MNTKLEKTKKALTVITEWFLLLVGGGVLLGVLPMLYLDGKVTTITEGAIESITPIFLLLTGFSMRYHKRWSLVTLAIALIPVFYGYPYGYAQIIRSLVYAGLFSILVWNYKNYNWSINIKNLKD